MSEENSGYEGPHLGVARFRWRLPERGARLERRPIEGLERMLDWLWRWRFSDRSPCRWLVSRDGGAREVYLREAKSEALHLGG
jgi:hypothetical protein